MAEIGADQSFGIPLYRCAIQFEREFDLLVPVVENAFKLPVTVRKIVKNNTHFTSHGAGIKANNVADKFPHPFNVRAGCLPRGAGRLMVSPFWALGSVGWLH